VQAARRNDGELDPLDAGEDRLMLSNSVFSRAKVETLSPVFVFEVAQEYKYRTIQPVDAGSSF
jgi:hypothetical protein